ncbi:hypothetical protein GCM10029964_059440 [Kibdelosporangium lantanae]
MTAMKHRPTHLYTVGEYAALGETEDRTELQEGIIVMSPSPSPVHMFAGGELFVQVRAQVPRNLVAIPEVDIDLGLAVLAGPGTVRRPDLVVVDEAAYEEWDAEGDCSGLRTFAWSSRSCHPVRAERTTSPNGLNMRKQGFRITGLSISTNLFRCLSVS